MPRDPRVVTQDPRSFTVKIRTPDTGTPLGTGVFVSTDGLVVTCAHVLRAGGIDPRRHGAPVGVYVPARHGKLAMEWLAHLAWYPDGYDDDVVCLRIDGDIMLARDHIATLGRAHESRDNHFISYGFRQLQHYLGGIADGTILGEVDPAEEDQLLVDPVQLRSSQISLGMSGAAVLDVRRNLVVGLVAETWFPDESGKDRDTAWAVDARVLDFSNLPVHVRDEPLPLGFAEHPVSDPGTAWHAVPLPGHRLGDAPSPVADWVGRTAAIHGLDEVWRHERVLVVGLIGFGGEGKSSLARHWIDEVMTRDDLAVFWWSFTERGSADDFLDAALEFMSGGQLEAEGGNRATIAASMLGQRRYLFVLDGLETMQYQHGDRYGSIVSQELREFLALAASPGHRSLCVLTSRAPVLDLTPYVTYRHVAVEPLALAEGAALLRRLGVIGSDAAVGEVVHDWGGHALTLTVIAAYLVRRYGGDARKVRTLPPPEPGQPRDEQVRRILAEYDACLSGQERGFLIRCSIYRVPVPLEALRAVAGDVGWAEMHATLRYLMVARIVRQDGSGRYGLHPIIRDFYAEQGRRDVRGWRRLHSAAQRYYLGVIVDSAGEPSLESLTPGVEAAHHACASGSYEDACDIIDTYLYQGDRAVITSSLNAYETTLSAFSEFFPRHEVHDEPLVAEPVSRGWILHETATCLQMLGRLRESASVFRRAGDTFTALGEWHDAAISCQNMTELYLSLGALPRCAQMVTEAFDLAARADDREDELVAYTLLGALEHLHGNNAKAGDAFAAALRIAAEHTPIPALYSSSGVHFADHLHRTGRTEQAAKVHRRNRDISQAAGWQADVSRCHVGLGDIALSRGDTEQAAAEYEQALRIARNTTRRDVLIAALLGHGRCARHRADRSTALSALGQALQLAVLGGYRLAEVDARIALAQLRIDQDDREAAWADLTQAEEISAELGYHWGQVDAHAVRVQITGPSTPA